MKEEEKQLLLKDLCARLYYGVKIAAKDDDESYTLLAIHPNKDIAVIGLQFDDVFATSKIKIEGIKPYLRPLSSMTEEEEITFLNKENYEIYDWLNAHHFDYRNLIEKNLALEAQSEMY